MFLSLRFIDSSLRFACELQTLDNLCSNMRKKIQTNVKCIKRQRFQVDDDDEVRVEWSEEMEVN
jgi:hypothetical protein